ncbi:MAG: LamG domain-containing protein [Candidatus Diapherotrites archaeon]|nr:LamG domain-containing protein [Candidatus Diapherotrites archaeon]
MVLVASIVGVFVFLVSPSQEVVFSSSDQTKILLKSGAVSADGGAGLVLQNASGAAIKVNSVHFFGDIGPAAGFKFNGAAPVFPVAVVAGGEMRFDGLASNNSCKSGGSVVVVYTDAFNYERVAKVVCNGGATPAAWYMFDEGSGTTAKDSSGNNDATVAGSPVWSSDCASGKCLQFDGSTTNYVIKNAFSGFPTTEITAEFWIKSSDATRDGTPLSYASSQSDNDFLIFNYRGFSIYRGSSSVGTAVSANDGAWHHIVVTWRSSDGQARLYKDGARRYSGTLAAGTSIKAGGALVVAQEQDFVGGGFAADQAFVGYIDDVKIFNRALSDFEICSSCREHAGAVGVTCAC